MTLRHDVTEYIEKKYKAAPEHLWMKYPDYTVFRHADNRKWFGLIMNIPREKLGMPDQGTVDILNIKTEDPLLADLLVPQPGYFRAYHMSKEKWISVLLDGTVPLENIRRLLDASYAATASKTKTGECI